MKGLGGDVGVQESVQEDGRLTDLQAQRRSLLRVLLPAALAPVWGPCGPLHSESIHQTDITAIQR